MSAVVKKYSISGGKGQASNIIVECFLQPTHQKAIQEIQDSIQTLPLV